MLLLCSCMPHSLPNSKMCYLSIITIVNSLHSTYSQDMFFGIAGFKKTLAVIYMPCYAMRYGYCPDKWPTVTKGPTTVKYLHHQLQYVKIRTDPVGACTIWIHIKRLIVCQGNTVDTLLYINCWLQAEVTRLSRKEERQRALRTLK